MRHEIFRAGTRTDNSGRTITITPEQVAAIASHYSPDKHEAPIVVGHPSTNAPAYGWVGSLKAEKTVLASQKRANSLSGCLNIQKAM